MQPRTDVGGEHDVARAYVLYRAKRQEERAQQQAAKAATEPHAELHIVADGQRVPLDLDLPYWVEDDRFDLEYHVRHIALPKPGDWRQFCIQASRIHARPLDLDRPLWEIYVIEGLDAFLDLPAGSFALLTKMHHAAIDIDCGSELTMLLHDIRARAAPPVVVVT